MREGSFEALAAYVGRFYGDGYRWAIALEVSELIRLSALITDVVRFENVR